MCNTMRLSDRHGYGYGYVVRVIVLVKAPLTVRSIIDSSNSHIHGDDDDDDDDDNRNNINNSSSRRKSSSGCKMCFYHG
jgi:hypothetical protein